MQRRSLYAAAFAAWSAYLALDFLAHAVALAQWWRATESYWLPPAVLFERIPIAYVAFAMYTLALTWLLVRLTGSRPAAAAALGFGAAAGLLTGLVSVLSTYSVLAMPSSALLVWPATAVVESAGAAAAAAYVLRGDHTGRRAGLVLLVAIALVVAGVLIQNVLFPVPG